ncbi:unnamed protein product [Spirodela intermedia]|uniref:Uncharacterized protein n=1 Tax=Spirodela intermedia TaxID=51605 RepID=A0A7I8KBJ9_SPIIN|nr:unnamed protein product [Spirodela intermedia]
MARGRGGVVGEWGRGGGGKWLPCKRTTVAVCCVNLLALLYVLRALYTSLYVFSSSSSTVADASSATKFSEDQIQRMKESIRLRSAAEPTELARLVKRLRKKLPRKERDLGLSQLMKQELATEILQMLRALEPHAYVTEQQEALERWRLEKLETVKRVTRDSSTSAREAKLLERALEVNWFMLLEEIGLSMPNEVINEEVDDRPEQVQLEEESIPPKCHAEPHTEYDGVAVRWGLTHLKETAADCCQACLDQAKRAKDGEMKCNVWVYCPSETGCYSPDVYVHKHQECWLKQSEKPRLSFKDAYPEWYRNSHPTAPLTVPWISGVIG